MKKQLTIVILILFISTNVTLASSSPEIVGEAAILMDRKTGTILYEKNSNIRMYPASTTKILTTLLCIESLDLSDVISKTSDSINNIPSDSSHIGLELGDQFSVLDGLHAVMLGSDNYVSHDLALYSDGSIPNFAKKMNRKAKEIGAHNSNFVNPHGYHHPNHYTTASDLLTIANYAFQNDTFCNIVKTPTYRLYRYNKPSNPIDIINTVELLDPDCMFYNPDCIGGKTGFHTPAGRCLVGAANKDNMELIAVIMKSTKADYFNDMNLLFDYGFDNFSIAREEGKDYINNKSYSPWAEKLVNMSIYNGFIDKRSTTNYQDAISKKDFVKLLIKSTSLAENINPNQSNDSSIINKALKSNIIKTDSILSKFYDPITREEVTCIIDTLLESLHYNPVSIYPVKLYNDHEFINDKYLQSVYNMQQNGIMGNPNGEFFNPKENLTFEEALSIINKLYNLYSNSLCSYMNAA